MKNTHNSRHRKLERSNSGQKRRFSPMLGGAEPKQNFRLLAKDSNPTKYGAVVRLSAANNSIQNNIRN